MNKNYYAYRNNSVNIKKIFNKYYYFHVIILEQKDIVVNMQLLFKKIKKNSSIVYFMITFLIGVLFCCFIYVPLRYNNILLFGLLNVVFVGLSLFSFLFGYKVFRKYSKYKLQILLSLVVLSFICFNILFFVQMSFLSNTYCTYVPIIYLPLYILLIVVDLYMD